MAFSVTLYENFKKKTNSTKIPDNTVTQRTFQNVEIKEQSSLINPVIKFLFDGSAKFMEYNYAYIPYFNRYYFIDNIVYNSGRYEAYLTCDVLASYKTDIGNSTQYVLRSTALQNVDVTDTYYPKTGIVTHKYNDISYPLTTKLENGIYVVGIVNNATNTRGCTSYYTMSNSQFRALSHFLLSDPSYMGIDGEEISIALQKALINPMQYITSVVWIPISGITGEQTSIKIGWWEAAGVTGGLLSSDSVYSLNFSVPMIKHPQTNSRGDWVNGNSGTQISLLLPPFGKIALDANKLIHNEKIMVYVNIDLVTGASTLSVYGMANENNTFGYAGLVYYTECQLGVQMSVNAINQSAGFYSKETLFNFLTPVANNLLAFANNSMNLPEVNPAIADTWLAPNYSSQTVGGNGSLAAFKNTAQILFDFFQFAPDFNEDFGRPLCEPHKISDLPGFILCSSNDIEIAGTREETEKIGNYLTGGFFYE